MSEVAWACVEAGKSGVIDSKEAAFTGKKLIAALANTSDKASKVVRASARDRKISLGEPIDFLSVSRIVAKLLTAVAGEITDTAFGFDAAPSYSQADVNAVEAAIRSGLSTMSYTDSDKRWNQLAQSCAKDAAMVGYLSAVVMEGGSRARDAIQRLIRHTALVSGHAFNANRPEAEYNDLANHLSCFMGMMERVAQTALAESLLENNVAKEARDSRF